MIDENTVASEEETASEMRQQAMSRRVSGLRGLAGVLAHAVGSSASLDEQDALWLLRDGLEQLDVEINRLQ